MKKLICILVSILTVVCLSSCDWTTEVDTSFSPDEKYSVTLYNISEPTPGNCLDGKIVLKNKDGKNIAETEETFWYGEMSDGKWLKIQKDSWSVVWEENKVIITLYGLYYPYNDTRTIEWNLE